MRSEGRLISVSPVVAKFEVTSLMEENSTMTEASVPSYSVPTIRKKDFQLKHKLLSCNPESRKNLDLEDDKNERIETDVKNSGSLLMQKTFGEYSEPSSNYTSYLCDVNKEISFGPSRSFTDLEKDVTIGQQRDCFVTKASHDENHIKHIGQLNMKAEDAMSPTSSRHPSPDLRTRDILPCDEIKIGNKHYANAKLCAFYSKGWCIKGDSCSFVHIKDPENKSGQQTEGEPITQNRKRELQPEEGNRDDVKRSRMPCSQVPTAATHDRTSLYISEFSLNPIIQKEVGPSCHSDKGRLVSSFPSCLTHTEGKAVTHAESYSHDLNIATHIPTTCMSLPHHIPSQSGCLSGSLSKSSIESQQLLNGGMSYHDIRSTFCGSRREILTLRSSFGVLPHLNGCKSKFSSCDWEPSVPFKPSFFITSPSLSSVEDLNDPIYSSVEIPNMGDGSLKAIILSRRTSIQTISQLPANGESVGAVNQGSDIHGAESSVSSHNRCNNTKAEKSFVPQKGSVTTEGDGIAPGYSNCQVIRADTGFNTFEDVENIGKEKTECRARLRVEVAESKKPSVDRNKKYSEMDFNLQKDVGTMIESADLRNFHFALVEHVKEILRPVWNEGNLSKDAHNVIVKKTVDKIISTLQPQQIPPNEDSIKKYLSFCHVKIANLVKDYTSIYGQV